jgi:sulfite reductase (NADPH) hemoprotein beta-component
LVKAVGIEEFRRQVEADWADIKDGPGTLTAEELNRVAAFFIPPAYETLPANDPGVESHKAENKAFANWILRNVRPHKIPGYAAVVLSLKRTGVAPGDASAEQMDDVADLADRFSFGELRVTHKQNLVLADVKQSDLINLWKELTKLGMASPNIGLLTDIICCPGADYCTLAFARSIPLAKMITERFDNFDFLHDIGDIELNMSGCVNACGHNHVGHIGVIGVDKQDGGEWYQVSIGGAQGNNASIGKIIGPSFNFQQMPEVIDRLLEVYVRERVEEELFIDTVRRIGITPFKEYVYATPINTENAVDKHAYGIIDKPDSYTVQRKSRF